MVSLALMGCCQSRLAVLYNSTRPVMAFKFTLFDRDTGAALPLEVAHGGLAGRSGVTVDAAGNGHIVGYGSGAPRAHGTTSGAKAGVLPVTNADQALTFIKPAASTSDDDELPLPDNAVRVAGRAATATARSRTVTVCLRDMVFTDALLGTDVHVKGTPYSLPCLEHAIGRTDRPRPRTSPLTKFAASVLCCVSGGMANAANSDSWQHHNH